MRSCKHTLFPWNFFVINFSLVFSQFELDYLFQKEIITCVQWAGCPNGFTAKPHWVSPLVQQRD